MSVPSTAGQPDNELRDFHNFVATQLAANPGALSPEDVVDLWRDQHPQPDDPAAVADAVRAALADMERGDLGQTLEEFDLTFRARHGLANRA